MLACIYTQGEILRNLRKGHNGERRESNGGVRGGVPLDYVDPLGYSFSFFWLRFLSFDVKRKKMNSGFGAESPIINFPYFYNRIFSCHSKEQSEVRIYPFENKVS